MYVALKPSKSLIAPSILAKTLEYTSDCGHIIVAYKFIEMSRNWLNFLIMKESKY